MFCSRLTESVKKAIMIFVILQSGRFHIGTEKGFRDRLCLAAVAAVVIACCGDNKTAENIYKRDMPLKQ